VIRPVATGGLPAVIGAASHGDLRCFSRRARASFARPEPAVSFPAGTGRRGAWAVRQRRRRSSRSSRPARLPGLPVLSAPSRSAAACPAGPCPRRVARPRSRAVRPAPNLRRTVRVIDQW